jgi:hypothetical protein
MTEQDVLKELGFYYEEDVLNDLLESIQWALRMRCALKTLKSPHFFS